MSLESKTPSGLGFSDGSDDISNAVKLSMQATVESCHNSLIPCQCGAFMSHWYLTLSWWWHSILVALNICNQYRNHEIVALTRSH